MDIHLLMAFVGGPAIAGFAFFFAPRLIQRVADPNIRMVMEAGRMVAVFCGMCLVGLGAAVVVGEREASSSPHPDWYVLEEEGK
tara:strand:+ start:856 stop:1107 length:252 start_codon:yes stop_codon:yes gene_type:complete